MVLKRIILLVCLLFSFVNAQELFYTDSYLSNLYQWDEEQISFHNNVFELINESDKAQVLLLFNDFFKDQGINANRIASDNPRQLLYTYQSSGFDALAWSKSWHQNYEPQLNKTLRLLLSAYFEQALTIPGNIEEAAIMKLAYYDWQNFGSRSSDFSKTRLHFSSAKVNTFQFIRDNFPPNLSLSRIVTNSFQNYYNEAYPVHDLKQSTYFVFGPSSKARLKDCVSMHIYAYLNNLSPPYYLNNQTILLKASNTLPPSASDLNKLLVMAAQKISAEANDFHSSFYSKHDLNILPDIIENYTLADYLDFHRIYFEENSYNIGQPLSKLDSCFNKAILNKELKFKVNSIQFSQANDSAVLLTLAQFMLYNPTIELILIGGQEKEEYTKIDRTKFKALVDSYQEYPPVKSSKRANLAIYRSVVVFDFLVKHGVSPKRVSCLSNKTKLNQVSNTKVYWVTK